MVVFPNVHPAVTPDVGSLLKPGFRLRSEEHTSELQSRLHLVCRLLLEKKKTLARHVTAATPVYTNDNSNVPAPRIVGPVRDRVRVKLVRFLVDLNACSPADREALLRAA